MKGRVYTPGFLVSEMLDFAHYEIGNVSQKHVIDNSCGDGAFLTAVVRVYCEDFLKGGSDLTLLGRELETYVHGIEIDAGEAQKCRDNLDAVAREFGLPNLNWQVRCADALTVEDCNGRMDFVLGNPPYVRVHNLEDSYSSVRRFSFAQCGMTDLFIVFFELGFRMLAPRGVLCYVTPSSWLTSKAGQRLRDSVRTERNLRGVIDLEHFQAFKATTYSLISKFTNDTREEKVDYLTFDPSTRRRRVRERLAYRDFIIGDGFYFSPRDSLRFLREVVSSDAGCAVVKNGFATLADGVFIGEFPFADGTIDVVKASTGKWRKCVYPYDREGRPLPLEQIARDNRPLHDYLLANQDRLQKDRTMEHARAWHLFGRSQAIKDVWKEKVAVNTLVREVKDVKLVRVPAGAGVYSGLYILSDFSFETIQSALCSDDFIKYVRTLKNYKSGGYYTFNTREVERFLNYKLMNYKFKGTDA